MRLSHALLILSACFLTRASPAVATVVARDIRVEPAGDFLHAGDTVNLTAVIEIVPSGATTFAETHTLSLATGLRDPHWNVVVTLDGNNAAVIPKEGSRVYVNGFLLFYPTTQDVGLEIELRGNIPSAPPDSEIMLIGWEELNAQGRAVTGSGYQFNRVAGPVSPEETPSLAPTERQHPSGPAPTETPFPVSAPILALCLVSAQAALKRQ